ncbi:hypothetical protein GCM10022393_26120 [Aquimarina addita]|uniref:Prolyl 4-hydroxylase alpha subunit domain-containing protein n=1 Tax=Aquimarina addita TaxID=870485 RepID=A0ABP6UNQ9_9FLAO
MYTHTKINGLSIIEIEDFLTNEEINALIAPRKNKFETAISHYPEYYRNNERLVEDTKEISSLLFNKLTTLNILQKETDINPIKINERIRFCKYQKDQLFSKHQDGIYYPDANSESKFTFLLYLNGTECFEGGMTDFYKSGEDKEVIKSIIPAKGKLVIFDHKIWHKGAIVTKGDKYILRSDIIVKRISNKKHHDGYIWNLLRLNENSFLSCGRDTKIKLWNADLELQKTIQVHTKSVLKMVHFDTTHFVSCSRDFTIKKWNISGTVLSEVSMPEMIINLKVYKNNKIIAVGTSGTLYLLNTDLTMIKKIKIHQHWIWGLSITNDYRIITCSEDGSLHLTNLLSGITKCIYQHDTPLFCLNVEKKDTIFIGSKGGVLIQLCLQTNKISKTKLHTNIIRSIKLTKNKIITCGEDNQVIVTDNGLSKTKLLFKAQNFIQDIIVLRKKVFMAGYDGEITSTKV